MIDPIREKKENPDLPGMVHAPMVQGLPEGYQYGVTRYADVILAHAFPQCWEAILENIQNYFIDIQEILDGGGSRSAHTKRHDDGLTSRGWNKHNITIAKYIDGEPIYKVKNHEIDVFRMGDDGSYPGVAVEMEWNNKDPFFHRDLANFASLHREGVIAVGVIVTRGAKLQRYLEQYAKYDSRLSPTKYGKATTHWNKLIPMVNVGGGGECPLFLIGIEPQRVRGWPEDFLRALP